MALTIVVFAVVGVSGLIAVIALLFGGDPHAHVGRGGIPAQDPKELETQAMHDEEVEQMLAARARRRAARGQDAAGMDDELAGLLGKGTKAPTPRSPEVEAEARAIVDARNARRRRRGQPEKDPVLEVAELLRELGA